MPKNSGHFSIHLPTRPHLACFIAAQYGNPVILRNDNLMGVVILSLLQKSVCTHASLQKKHVWLRGLTTQITCLAPWKYMYSYGIDLTDDHIMQINRYFDQSFQESLYHFVQRNTAPYARVKGIDKALEKFAYQYGIIIEQHITFENLKKMEYRFRKNREEILATNVPSIAGSFQPTLFAAS